MKTYSISQLARLFGLARSTLLYYERIGLLRAPHRSAAGYRRYTREEYTRLERICVFRRAGLPLSDVKKLIDGDGAPGALILEKRMGELEAQIRFLRGQQHTIVAMLKEMTSRACGPIVDKDMWVKMLAAAGVDEVSRIRWHAEFEARAPGAHHDFLLSLGIPEREVLLIRDWSRNIAKGGVECSELTDLDAWIELAREVEPLFGPMARDEGFREALREAVLKKTAFCIRSDPGGGPCALKGGIVVSAEANEIAWFAVSEKFRGKGYGRQLLEFGIGRLDPRKGISVQTFDDAIPEGMAARKLYTDFGFTDHKKGGLNPAGVPTVIMTLERK